MHKVSLIRMSSDVIRYQLAKDEDVIRNFDIKLYYTYIIEPISKDNKHNGRHCIIMKFESDEKATVKFTDTGRIGKIKLNDLNQIESIEDKKLKAQERKVVVEQLLQDALLQRDELDKKIGLYRQELFNYKFELEKLERY